MMIVSAERAGVRALTFEDFFAREYSAVYRASYLSTGSRETAQDVTQEAFARAYSRWTKLRNEPWAGGWVMTTAVNLCKRHHKQSSRRLEVHPRDDLVDNVSDTSLDLSAALQRLPLRQRTATVLFYLGDLPVDRIARLMDVSEETVKAHLAQARSSLKKLMEAPHE